MQSKWRYKNRNQELDNISFLNKVITLLFGDIILDSYSRILKLVEKSAVWRSKFGDITITFISASYIMQQAD